MLTDSESRIVELLRRNPLMGSEALAAALGTSRASVNVHLSNLGKKGVILGRGYVLAEQPGAVVIGGANIDMKARSSQSATAHTSNPGHGSMAPGGVARNIAENLARLGDRVHLISVVGRDALGDNLVEHTSKAGVHMEHVARTDRPTGTYTAVLDSNGELVIAIADMDAVRELGPAQLHAARDLLASAAVVVIDGNVTREAFEQALDLTAGVHVVVEPVSVPKAAALRHSLDERVFAITPGRDELSALTGLPTRTDKQVRAAARALHDIGLTLVWVTLGERGSLLSSPDGDFEIPALPAQVEDVTGAGDSMVAAFCHGLIQGVSPVEAARLGHAAAALTISSPHTVRPDLTLRMLHETLNHKDMT